MTQSHSPSPAPKPPLAEQITDIAIKVIRPGGVTAGGVGAIWFLFLQSDIPRAIASFIIGTAISYGAKLLEPIHKGNQARLTKTGEAINQVIDDSLEKLLARLMAQAKHGTLEERYLACQAMACQALRSEGVIQRDRILIPLLAEVFVTLSVDISSTVAGYRRWEIKSPERTDLNIWDFLSKAQDNPAFRQMAILAWGGSGKTTMLKHVAYCYGSNQLPRNAPKQKYIPFLLLLRKHRGITAQANAPTLPEIIATFHVPALPDADDLPIEASWVEKILQNGRAIVMLDGFDEVPKDQRPAVAAWINQQMGRYSKSVFIVTARPKAYQEQHERVSDPAQRLELPMSLWVQNFNESQRREFVEKWYFCQEKMANAGRNTPDVRDTAKQEAADLLQQIESRQELQDLAKNPLLLNMMVNFHRRNVGAKIPQRRVELYGEICQLQIKDRIQARQLETLLTQCEALTILQQVALTMQMQRLERIEREALLAELDRILQQEGEAIDRAEFLEQVVQISELLVRQEEEYEFAHLSFQEYLAASYLVKTEQETLLYGYLEDDKWKPTILLYVALVKNPTTLLEQAMQQGAIALADQCLRELPKTKRLPPALAEKLAALTETITDARYQKLEEYLKNGQWKEADHETYRLMITTVGKEEGQYFTSKEEILNFPCDVLLTIDHLWVTHSQGKFGFSVQKDIYVNQCGGVPDGQYDQKAFRKFGDAVGWRENGRWEFNVKFDTSSPSGHLPLWWWLGDEEGGFRGGLFSRIAHCKL